MNEISAPVATAAALDHARLCAGLSAAGLEPPRPKRTPFDHGTLPFLIRRDGTWLFRGNVKITTDEGDLTSDEAQIKFLRQRLTTAVVNGKPASFEKHLAKTGKLAQGHADTIDYDVAKGIVRLTKNGWLTDGSYEIHGDSLKYNMLTQTMNAEGSASGPGPAGPSSAPGTDPQDSQRVHITVPPPATKP